PDQWSPFYAVPYFMFNVPTLSAPLESVKFSVYNPGDVTYEDFDGLLRDQGVVSNGDSPFEVKLWDYTGDPSLFISDFYTYFGPGSPDDTPWGDDLDDLRSGTQYGSRMMDSSLDGQWVDFYLTGDALTDIMAAQGGEFTFGMWQEDFNTAFYGEDVFSQQAGYEGQSHPLARLEFQFQNAIGSAIPEPSTYGLIATLVLGLTIVGRKIRRKA
ncbi:MAG: PEP-CTERM sorting domain-containing protein, partial [Verrucomicrobiae bacterium]|nr:PEP-CTERM sorting domain-containing protein [Verrucomicrobiae bacterium]